MYCLKANLCQNGCSPSNAVPTVVANGTISGDCFANTHDPPVYTSSLPTYRVPTIICRDWLEVCFFDFHVL